MTPLDTQPDPQPAASDSLLVACYYSPPGSRFRNLNYALTHSLQGALLLACLAVGAAYVGRTLGEGRVAPVMFALIFGFARPLLARFGFVDAQLEMLPWKSTFDGNGFTDETTGRKYSIPWRKITTIKYHSGDLYVFTWWGARSWVPREAFGSINESHQFFSRVLTLMNESKRSLR